MLLTVTVVADEPLAQRYHAEFFARFFSDRTCQSFPVVVGFIGCSASSN